MQNLGNLKLIFDIGSNVGNTVDIFKNVAEKVICFEPNPDLYNVLVAKYQNSNVVVDNRGLSNKNGIQDFYVSNASTISTLSNDWISNSRFTNDYRWDKIIQVETLTLNNIIDEFGIPDYIKIDIEGYEYEALSSFTKLLDNTLISFEWAEEQKDKIIKTLNHLFFLGYKNYAFTLADQVVFEHQINWTNYVDFDFSTILDENRKELWGMLYVKK